ncbi:MAG: helix-turn-helix domain-containing protein [Balneolaceae bacterium]|nr:helix-turn-helix domain-containing protein [Balneolaceae bacterium]
MKLVITTEDELKALIKEATGEILKDVLPGIIRKASMKEWLTTDDVMEYLRCSRRHVQHLRDSNQITFTQNGRTIRYHIDDVLEYLNRGKVPKRDC